MDLHFMILDENTVLLYIVCAVCGRDTVKEVPWEWAVFATPEDLEQIAVCEECIEEKD
ncbi:MAG: hypothetical protein MUC63_01735 [Planctomycetes bacterium]|jgi:hypothetical protein|nr:hypothetical protein [Planctomycetota bacterium]